MFKRVDRIVSGGVPEDGRDGYKHYRQKNNQRYSEVPPCSEENQIEIIANFPLVQRGTQTLSRD